MEKHSPNKSGDQQMSSRGPSSSSRRSASISDVKTAESRTQRRRIANFNVHVATNSDSTAGRTHHKLFGFDTERLDQFQRRRDKLPTYLITNNLVKKYWK
jgi:hypothetical protein